METLDKMTFRNPTDKAIASLSFDKDITPQIFKKIMDVICCAGFDSKEITLESIPDIDRLISEQRKEDASARSASGTLSSSSSSYGFPNIVLDLLFEHIGEMIVPFGAIAKEHWDSFYLQRDTNRMLKKLSLVHRTWTPYCQNLLRRRLMVSTQTKARSYLQSPLLGPWVRELALHYRIHESKLEHAMLNDLFRRIPEVQYISVHLLGQTADEEGQEVLAHLTGAIGRFSRSVRAIWLSEYPVERNLSGSGNGVRYKNLLANLPELTELRYLSISCEVDDFGMLPLSIKVLELNGNDTYLSHCIKMLLEDKSRVLLRELSLDFSLFEKNSAIGASFPRIRVGTTLASLKNLYIDFDWHTFENRSELYDNICASLTNGCPNLESLDVFVDPEFTINFPAPLCLKKLTVHFRFPLTSRGDPRQARNLELISSKETTISRFIQSLSNLEYLILTSIKANYSFSTASIRYMARRIHSLGTEIAIPPVFAATARVCGERGIIVTCKEFSV